MSRLTHNTIDAAGGVVTKIINDARVTNVTTDTQHKHIDDAKVKVTPTPKAL